MSFLSKLIAARKKDDRPVMANEALAACMLDAHSVDSSRPVRNGMDVWRLPAKGVSHLVAKTLGQDGLNLNHSIYTAKPSQLVAIQDDLRLGGMQLTEIIASNANIALMTTGDSPLSDPRLMHAVKRTVRMTWSPRTLALFAAWKWPRFKRPVDYGALEGNALGLDDVLFAALGAESPAQFKENLKTVHAITEGVDQHHDHDDLIPRTDAEPIAKAASTVVRKLSEMSGFGDAKEWGLNLAQDLRDYTSGELAWADVDKGILLSSPPGGGKTTFARALAAEVGDDVHFEAVTYATFEGAGSFVVRTMSKKFTEWRQIASEGRCVLVFWDKIDSLGARGKNSHNDSYWSAIINALLAFLDGAEPRDGIVMIAATNIVDRVDPALRRPGRLDQHVVLPAPGVEALAAMVALHLRVDPAAPETLEGARALRGRSPAQLEQWCRATRRMGRKLKRAVDGQDLADLVRFSRPFKTPAQDRSCATHEAGHAVATLYLGHDVLLAAEIDGDETTEGGVAFVLRDGASSMDIVNKRLAATLAGRAAEDVILNEKTSGSRTDLVRATRLAHTALWEYGLGSRLFSVEDMPATMETLAEVEVVLQQAYAVAIEIVTKQRRFVEVLADALLQKRHMEAREIISCLAAFQIARRRRFLTQVIVDREPPEPDHLAYAA